MKRLIFLSAMFLFASCANLKNTNPKFVDDNYHLDGALQITNKKTKLSKYKNDSYLVKEKKIKTIKRESIAFNFY